MNEDSIILQQWDTVTVIPFRQADSLALPEEEGPEHYLLLCDDSISAHYAPAGMTTHKSLFSSSLHSGGNVEPQPRENATSGDWVFGVIILLAAFISLCINSRRIKLRDMMLSIFDLRVRERVWRENNIRIRNLLPMTFIYWASLALVALRMAQRYDMTVEELHPALLYLLVAAGLILFILLKNGLIRLLGNVFEMDESCAGYITNNHLFYGVGSLLMPLLLLLVFFAAEGLATVALRVTLFLIVILFVVRVLFGFRCFLTNSGSSKLYLFYYLCILEIVPILVMAKIFII